MIPEAAVEAAAKAVCRADEEWSSDDYYARLAQAALEAAAQHMLAECWDAAIEAHKAWTWDDENVDPLTNPYRSQA